MGYAPDNCTAAGIGPNCDVGDRALGDKLNCLMHERWRVLSELNRCIANIKIEESYHYSFYQFLNPGIQGFAMSKGTDSLAASQSSAQARADGIADCFETLDANWKACYCTEMICESCLGDDTGARGLDPKRPGGNSGDDTDDPIGDSPDDGPLLSNIAYITTSRYLEPIQAVYGSQIVSGNVIWIGGIRHNATYKVTESIPDYGGATTYSQVPPGTDVEVVSVLSQVSVTSRKVPVATVDFALALGAGPINGIGRIWLNDKLIFDNRIGITDGAATAPDGGALIATIQDASATGAASNDVSLTRTEIVLYRGTEDQIPPDFMGTGIGAVGYRGLAFILFKNFNVSANRGIPAIRVEVIHDVSDDTPFVESQLPSPFGGVAPFLSGIDPSFFLVQPESGTIVASANGSSGNHMRKGFRVIDVDTLEETGQCDPEITLGLQVDFNMASAIPVASGVIGVQEGSTLRFIDPVKNTILAALSGVPTMTQASITTDAFTAASRPAYLVAVPNGADVNYYWLDKDDNALTSGGVFASVFEGTPARTVKLDKVLNAASGKPTLLSKLFFVTVAPSAIRVYANTLRNAPTVTGFTPSAPILVRTFSSELWGGDSASISVLSAYGVSTTGHMVIVFENNAEYGAVCYDPFTDSVVWSVRLPSIPSHAFTYGEFNGLTWCFYGRDGFVYRVNLTTGEYENLGSVTAPFPVGPQHYNAADGSITYVSDLGSAKISRLYVGRTINRAQPLSSVLGDMCSRAGMSADTYDFSAISNYSLHGYIIGHDSTLRAVLSQFTAYYPIEISETNGKIVAVPRGLNDIIFLGDGDAAAGEDGKPAIALTEVDRYTQVEYMTVAYQKSDQAYSVSRQTLQKPAFLGAVFEIPDTTNVSLEYPFVLTDEEAKAICERVVYEASLEPNTATLVVGMAHVNLVPGMLVSVSKGDVSLTGLIRTIETETNHRHKLTITRAEATIYNENASLAADDDHTGTRTDDHLPVGRLRTPIIFPVPLPDGVTYTINTTHTLPFLVAPRPTGQPITEVEAYVRYNGSDRLFATFTKEVTLGTLRNKPVFQSSIFTTDTTSQLTIRFDSVPTLTSATKLALLNDPDLNLLIVGKELIQFMDFVIAPDGKTVTFTNLFRGKRGTDYACDNHVVGELCAIYDAEAIKVLNINMLTYSETSLKIGFINSTDSLLSLTYTSVPFSYYGISAPAPVNLTRTRNIFGETSFFFQPRANVPYDLPDDGKNNDYDTYNAVSRRTFFYLLAEPFDEGKFLQYLRGELPSYVISYARAEDAYNPLPMTAGAFSRFDAAVNASGIDLSVDEIYIVLQSQNPEYNVESLASFHSATVGRQRGFFEGYYFAKGSDRAVPANLGRV